MPAVYFDLDLNQLVLSPTNSTQVFSLGFQYRSTPTFELKFCRNGAVVDPGTPDEVFFVVKEAGHFEDPNAWVLTTSWTKSGSGTSAKWTASPDFTGALIAAALGNDGNITNDETSVTAHGSVGYIDGTNRVECRFEVVISNSLYSGSEPTPITTPSGHALAMYSDATTGAAYTIQASAKTVSSWARASNVLTINTSSSHGLAVGNVVNITGETAINGTYSVASVVDSDSFTVAQTGSNATAGSSTASARLLTNTLFGITTATLPLGTVLLVDNGSGKLAPYSLVSGTTATSLPDSLRGYDYASTTNERYWSLKSVSASVAWSDITSKPSTFTPATHASTHGYSGSDPITITTAQVTGLTDTLAGLDSNVTGLLSGLAEAQSDITALETSVAGKAAVSSATPAALGTASAGTSTSAARADHVHAMPTASDIQSGEFSTDVDSALTILSERTAGIEITGSTTATASSLHTVTASATLTDPTPAQGMMYWVLVRAGTATIGSTAYAPGTLIYRVYESGAWVSYPFYTNGTTTTLTDADATLSSTTRAAILGATLTAVRTITLPAASSFPIGTTLVIAATSGQIPITAGLILTRAGSDTINGATSVSLLAHGLIMFVTNGSNAWTTSRFPAVSLEVTTQQDVTGTSMTASTALSRYIGPGKYKVRVQTKVFNATTANGTKTDLSFSGTATNSAALAYYKANATSATVIANINLVMSQATLAGDDATAVDGNSSGAHFMVREYITTVTAGGTLSVRFAGWANSTTTSLAPGSQIQIEPIR